MFSAWATVRGWKLVTCRTGMNVVDDAPRYVERFNSVNVFYEHVRHFGKQRVVIHSDDIEPALQECFTLSTKSGAKVNHQWLHSDHHSSNSHSIHRPLRFGDIDRPSRRHRLHLGMVPFGRPRLSKSKGSTTTGFNSGSTVAVGVCIGIGVWYGHSFATFGFIIWRRQ